MKTSHRLVIFVAAITAIAFAFVSVNMATAEKEEDAASSVSAETASADEGVSIAVLDVQALLSRSKAAETIQEQARKKAQAFEKDIVAEDEALKKQGEKLQEDMSSMTREEFLAERAKFAESVQEKQQEVAKERAGLNRAVAQAEGKLRDEIVQITAEMAEEEGYDLVVSRQNVVLVSKDIDITDRVMETLNKRVKKIDLVMDDSSQ